MKKLLLLKTGSTFPRIINQYGDFEHMVIRQLEIPDSKALTIQSDQINKIDINNISGIIILGSHAMVTEDHEWITILTEWIKKIIIQKIPILGICFGHQIIAKALGGKITYHPKGIEIGTVKINITKNSKNDPLFKIYSSPIYGHVTHRQSIKELPINAVSLGFNDFESNHAVCFKKNQIWGTQFHPEFNAEITHLYIDEQKETLIKEGFNINSLHETIHDSMDGKLLLKRFYEYCNS